VGKFIPSNIVDNGPNRVAGGLTLLISGKKFFLLQCAGHFLPFAFYRWQINIFFDKLMPVQKIR